jgi:hypothetical protein
MDTFRKILTVYEDFKLKYIQNIDDSEEPSERF